MEAIIDGCRLCVKDLGSPICPLEDLDLQQQMKSVFYFPIDPKQGFSSSVCSACIFVIGEFYKFAENIRQNQDYLSIAISTNVNNRTNMVTQIKLEPLDPKVEDTDQLLEPKQEIIIDNDNQSDEHDLVDIKIEPLDLESDRPNQLLKSHEVTVTDKDCRSDVVVLDNNNQEPPTNHQKSALQKSKSETKEQIQETEKALNDFFRMVCELCGYEAPSFKLLLCHFKKIHCQPGYVVCCGEKLYLEFTLKLHMQNHMNPDGELCEICNKRFRNISLHRRMVHSKEEKKILCDKCPKAFVSMYSLKKHQTKTHQNVPCPQCDIATTLRIRIQPCVWSIKQYTRERKNDFKFGYEIQKVKVKIPPNRLQRWALSLLGYDFDIEYISTNNFGYADVLSRLIDNHQKPEEEFVIASIGVEDDVRANLQEKIASLPVTFEMIQQATLRDPSLQKVQQFMAAGWPHKNTILDPKLKALHARREALSVAKGCIMMDERLVVPDSFGQRILKDIHRGHQGMERMKAIARSIVYWPNIDDDIQSFVRRCSICASAAKSPPHFQPQPWPRADAPWRRIHIDYAGPMKGLYYFVIVDSFSKWPEIFETRSTTASTTIRFLTETFARYGVPETIVSDNGSQFASADFKVMCEKLGIIHIRTAPYHPQSNGQAERFVDTLKRSMRKIVEGEGLPSNEALQTFLQVYRSTPSAVLEGKSPAYELFGRPMRTTLDLLRLPTQSKIIAPCAAVKFTTGSPVFAKVYKNANKWSWIPGTVIEPIGKVNFNILLSYEHGRKKLIRSHLNQLRLRYEDTASTASIPKSKWSFDVLADDFGFHQPEAGLQEMETLDSNASFESATAGNSSAFIPAEPVEEVVDHPLEVEHPIEPTEVPTVVGEYSGETTSPDRNQRPSRNIRNTSDMKLASKKSLRAHIFHMHCVERTRMICDFCGKQFLNKPCFDRHVNKHKGIEPKQVAYRKIQCHICKKMLHAERALKRHLKFVHAETTETLECDVCHQKYPNSVALQSHKARVHIEAKFKCEICEKLFKQNVKLQEHRATHFGERLWKCEYCETAVKTKSSLWFHVKKHHPAEHAEQKRRAAEKACG
ncbi:uncharacterized protein LOC129752121 [Uranotaenia lowii]|uniref:uncharacterized protein LOC129752121 n=1 Tax=Uranotaenia lowii TaxID=190385 RepID=UPI00247B139B|nr:uncharacterized protein LOC129752121 [Uranotaenia lowii]